MIGGGFHFIFKFIYIFLYYLYILYYLFIGIGATPLISIINNLKYKFLTNKKEIKKILLIWSSRDKTALDVLTADEDLVITPTRGENQN